LARFNDDAYDDVVSNILLKTVAGKFTYSTFKVGPDFHLAPCQATFLTAASDVSGG
jgi:hypothetical protein